jgi:nucleolar protein 56
VLLLTTWFGSFLLEDGKVVKQALFPRDPRAIAERMALVEDWKVLDEERRLLEGLEEYFVTEPRLERAGGIMTTERPPFLDPEAFDYGRQLLHDAMVSFAEARMRRAVEPEDHIMQGVRAMDDLIEMENTAAERLRDWYSLHFPELPRSVPEARFAHLVAEYGDREAIPGGPWESIGAPLGPADRDTLQGLARTLQEINRRREEVEAYLRKRMSELAPNLTHLVGPILGAHLLVLARGLRELALLPASTAQLLGAEKALFRHLRTGARPPKHGVLFQHPWVHQSPPWQRGSVARALAARVVIAARADAFTKRDLGDVLRLGMEGALEEVRRRHPHRPPGKVPPVGRTRGRRRGGGRGRKSS